MKLNKILAIALAAVTFTACSSDDDVSDYPNFLGAVNTASGVTVSMEKSTFTAGENETPFFLPIQVSGTPNGKVVVTVQVKEATVTGDEEPAKEVEHYNITSKTINIPDNESTGFIEICPVWEQGVINKDRVFEVTITSVEGATVGSTASCKVIIANVDNAYTMMCGNWTLTGTDRSGAPVSYNITLRTPSATSSNYGTDLYGFGIFGQADYLLPFTDFEYDEVTGKGTMKIEVGGLMTDGVAFNYGDPVGVAYPVCLTRVGGQLSMAAEYVCEFDAEMKTLKIPAEANVIGGLFSLEGGSFTGYTVGQIDNMSMSR